jgi:hypothetical protein
MRAGRANSVMLTSRRRLDNVIRSILLAYELG